MDFGLHRGAHSHCLNSLLPNGMRHYLQLLILTKHTCHLWTLDYTEGHTATAWTASCQTACYTLLATTYSYYAFTCHLWTLDYTEGRTATAWTASCQTALILKAYLSFMDFGLHRGAHSHCLNSLLPNGVLYTTCNYLFLLCLYLSFMDFGLHRGAHSHCLNSLLPNGVLHWSRRSSRVPSRVPVELFSRMSRLASVTPSRTWQNTIQWVDQVLSLIV